MVTTNNPILHKEKNKNKKQTTEAPPKLRRLRKKARLTLHLISTTSLSHATAYSHTGPLSQKAFAEKV